MNHVFVSYVREDQDLVERLCADLSSQGVRVWLDRKEIKPGHRWKDAIREAIRHGDFFIACFSSAYLQRERTYMNQELTLAVEELNLRPTDRAWFIPVLLSECSVPTRSIGANETLLDIQWVPLYKDWQTGIQRIVDAISPRPREVQLLGAAISSSDVAVSATAAGGLAKLGQRGIEELLEAASQSTGYVQDNAIVALGNARNPTAVPHLIQIMERPDSGPEKCLLVVNALREIGDARATDALLSLSRLHSRDAQEGGVSSPSQSLREAIVNTLGSLRQSIATPSLLEILCDAGESQTMRRNTITALRLIRDPRAAATLGEVLAGQDTSLRLDALDALISLGHDSVPYLIQALDDSSEEVKEKAIEALGTFRDDRAIPALKNLAQSALDEVRAFPGILASWDGEIDAGEAETQETLTALGDSAFGLARQVATALSNFGAKETDDLAEELRQACRESGGA